MEALVGLVARDVCQRSWRDVTATIAWIFVRDGDLDSIKPNVLSCVYVM